MGQSADVMFLARWGNSATGTFAFGVKPVDFRLEDMVAGAENSSLSEFELSA